MAWRPATRLRSCHTLKHRSEVFHRRIISSRVPVVGILCREIPVESPNGLSDFIRRQFDHWHCWDSTSVSLGIKLADRRHKVLKDNDREIIFSASGAWHNGCVGRWVTTQDHISLRQRLFDHLTPQRFLPTEPRTSKFALNQSSATHSSLPGISTCSQHQCTTPGAHIASPRLWIEGFATITAVNSNTFHSSAYSQPRDIRDLSSFIPSGLLQSDKQDNASLQSPTSEDSLPASESDIPSIPWKPFTEASPSLPNPTSGLLGSGSASEPLTGGNDVPGASWANAVLAAAIACLPVDFVASAFIAAQTATGMPWWLTLVGGAVCLRAAILPLTLFQAHVGSRLAMLAPHMPPPLPSSPPLSREALIDAALARRQRLRELRVPSRLWLFLPPLLQVPAFFTFLLAVRQLAMTAPPGMDVGGCLWFEDLTAVASGSITSSLMPLAIAATFFTSIQVSLPMSQLPPGRMGFFFTIYRFWLEFLALPTFIGALYVPQAVHVYWLTNNLLTIGQALALRSDPIRRIFALPSLADMASARQLAQQVASAAALSARAAQLTEEDIAAMNEPEELLLTAAQLKAAEKDDLALSALRKSVLLDPLLSPAWIGQGQMHAKAGRWAAASECFSQALATARDKPNSTSILLAAYLGAGVSLEQQGRREEALIMLQNAASMELIGADARDPLNRKRHGQALVSFASLLKADGDVVRARFYLEKAAQYDPKVLELVDSESDR